MTARVLIVDDILPNIRLLEARLSSEYFEVVTATSGAEALEKVELFSPDIVLLDVMMPIMDGFEVCRRLKANPNTTHIPVVMITALTDSANRIKGLESGADDFLSKPVDDTALMARVRSLVRLKMTIDEWRRRENTANQFGFVTSKPTMPNEPCNKARILVVEDKSFEVEKIEEALDKDEDDIISTNSIDEALERVKSEIFDVIIVSLNLLHQDGLRLCSLIKSNEKSRSTPILIISEDTDMKLIEKALEMGVHDYILRPVGKNELLARVRTQVRRKRYQNRLLENYEQSLTLALIDSLTGLYNRRYLMVHLEKLLKKNFETKKTLCVLMLDIDFFKKVNDVYGHNVGDEVLKIFSKRISKNLRSFDLVSRIGGEEFFVVLPDVNTEMAIIVAERLRKSICDTPFNASTPEGKIDISVSVGGALISSKELTVEEALKAADEQLYAAKESGRNRVYFEGMGHVTSTEKDIDKKTI